jgi:hypothetical protein
MGAITPIKMGIEIEYLVMTKNGQPVASGWRCDDQKIKGLRILKRAAQILEPGIKRQTDAHGHVNVYKFKSGNIMVPDTFTLLETVTSPSTNLDKLRNQLWKMKKSLINASAEYDCLISGSACPIGYGNQSLSAAANSDTRCNNAGMHLHLNAPNDRVKIKLANLLVQIIPELTALSTNSPVYNKAISRYYSDRLNSSPLVGAENVEVLNFDPDYPLQFDDPRKRYRFVTVWTKSQKTIELRGFDTPMTIDWAMAIAALIQCLGVKATKLFLDETHRRSTVMSDKKSVRQKNFAAAVQKGMGAKFIPDNTTHINLKTKGKKQELSFLYHNKAVDQKKKINAQLAVKRLLYYIEAEASELGLIKYLDPIYQAVADAKNQSDLQIGWFKSQGYSGFLKKLTSESAKKPVNAMITPEKKITYLTVRQKAKGVSRKFITFTPKTLGQLNLTKGDQVIVSGPIASKELTVTIDKGSSKSLPLSDNEVRLGLSVRDNLGVSLYDPVIIWSQPMVPIIVQKTGEKWEHTPQPIKKKTVPLLKVHKGLKKYSPNIALSEKDAKLMGVSDGDTIGVSSSNGKTADFPVVLLSDLRPGIVAMMLKDRNSIGVQLGDSIRLTKKRTSVMTQKKLKVVSGDRRDIGASPPVIRINKSVLADMGVPHGAHANIEMAGLSGKALKTVVVKRNAKRRTSAGVGLVKSVRDAFNVDLGDLVTIAIKAP